MRGVVHKSLMKQKEIYDFNEKIQPKGADQTSQNNEQDEASAKMASEAKDVSTAVVS